MISRNNVIDGKFYTQTIKYQGENELKELKTIPHAVYHGTVLSHLPSIIKGIQFDCCNPHTDFGQGFYTTSNYGQALSFAQKQTKAEINERRRNQTYGKNDNTLLPLVLKYRVNLRKIKKINGKLFALPDEKWAEFVYNNRIGVNSLLLSSFHNLNSDHEYVFGHVADGKISLIIGNARGDGIDLKQFHAEIMPYSPTTQNQLSFHTNQAIKCITFEGSVIDHDFTYNKKNKLYQKRCR